MEEAAFISKPFCGSAWGQMVFPSKHCGGYLSTVQPRVQTAAVMEKQPTSLSVVHEQMPVKGMLLSNRTKLDARTPTNSLTNKCSSSVSNRRIFSRLPLLVIAVSKQHCPEPGFLDGCPSAATAFLDAGEGKPACFSLFENS